MTAGSEQRAVDEGLKVTVAIPTRDRPDSLCAVVRDIWAGQRRPDEILVVCQGDGVIEAARRLRNEVPDAASAVRFYESSRNGISANRNDAVRLATGDFIAFSDDDMSLPESWLETMLEVWARDWDCTDVVLTGPIQAPKEATDPNTTPGRRIGTARRVWRTPPPYGDVLYGGHFGAPRSAYSRIGLPPFDERLGPGTRFPGAEDEEFALQALRAGVPIVFEPSIQAIHLRHASTWVRIRFKHSQGSGAMFVLRLSWGDRGSLSAIGRTILGVAAKGVRAAVGLRIREAAGRFAGLAGIALGAWRWRVSGAQHTPRAQEPEPGDLTLVHFD